MSDLRLGSGPRHCDRSTASCWGWWERDRVTGVKSPRERIELDISLVNLASGRYLEQVEALDFVLLAADSGE